jgi:aspartate racemase
MVDHLALLGAEIILAGCTELSVGFKMIEDMVQPWIDPLEIVANVTLDLAFGYRSLPKDNNGHPMGYQHNKPDLISVNGCLPCA